MSNDTKSLKDELKILENLYERRSHELKSIELLVKQKVAENEEKLFHEKEETLKKIEELSKGMAQKVQFIVTVLHRPKLLIFDEPFSGFDPINAELLKNEILRLKEEGATVIFSTHNMASVEEICDNITLINKSRNILSGNVEEIRRKYFGHRYDLLYEGDDRSLMEALQSVGNEFEVTAADQLQGRRRLTFHLKEGVGLRDAIAIANDSVRLAGISESIASMNDIFIRAVREDESCR